MVSIIVPIYNTEKFLKKCLFSIQNQTYKDFEVIMVDDGSEDSSAKLAKEFEIEDKRFKLITQKNCGVSVARNNGLSIAIGDYILFIDSDDWIESQMLEILISNLEKSESDISCCQYDRGINGVIDDYEIWSKDQTIESFLIHQKFNGSLVNKLIKRSVIGNIRFNINIKYGEDALFLWKVLMNINRIVITNKVLYHVTLHNDSASGGGSYKPIRKDCINVWSEISEEAIKSNKNWGLLAKAQLANMAFFSLYEMAYYKYKDKKQEKKYLKILKNNIDSLKYVSFISQKEKILSSMAIINYNMVKTLIALRRKIFR